MVVFANWFANPELFGETEEDLREENRILKITTRNIIQYIIRYKCDISCPPHQNILSMWHLAVCM